MAYLNTKNSFFPPVLAAFSREMLKTGEIHTFFQKMSQTGEMLKMHKLQKLQL